MARLRVSERCPLPPPVKSAGSGVASGTLPDLALSGRQLRSPAAARSFRLLPRNQVTVQEDEHLGLVSRNVSFAPPPHGFWVRTVASRIRRCCAFYTYRPRVRTRCPAL